MLDCVVRNERQKPPVRQEMLSLLKTVYNLIIRYKQSKYLATHPPKMTNFR
jgi:hypothetical protein